MNKAPPFQSMKNQSGGAATASPTPESLARGAVFLTVRQTAERFPAFTESAIRSLIFTANAETKLQGARAVGFSAAVVRVPGQRKVLISEQGFIDWLSSGKTAE